MTTARCRLTAIYRSSRIGMVTPLRDGMNLVAKEYVAAQDPEDPGVLILSRFAGAAEELGDALIVNPYDISSMAEVIRVALEMSIAERRARHQALMTVVERRNIAAWCQSFLTALDRVYSPDDPETWPQPESIRNALENLRQSARQAPKPGNPGTKVAPTATQHR
jgi:trehalose 6-phosphate synthase